MSVCPTRIAAERRRATGHGVHHLELARAVAGAMVSSLLIAGCAAPQVSNRQDVSSTDARIANATQSTSAAPAPAPTSAASPAARPAAPSTTLANYDIEQDIFHPVVASNGMVATEQHLATQVGLDILKRGGNAVDAAVAVGFALAVALPNAGNIGGGGFMIVHDARTGKDVALDFREVAPAAASRDMYLDDKGNVVPNRSLYTHLASGVPGTVAGMDHALRQWGTMKLADVIAPAIRLAERGYPVSESLASMLKADEKNMGQWASSRAIFFRDGKPMQQGDRLVQKDLANSLRLIANHGPKAFYDGPIAEKIVAEMQRHGGLITRDDLRRYKVVERDPVKGSYRGYQIVSMPPPSSGGVHIIQMLNVLSHFDLARTGPDSAATIHDMAETMKYAYADRSEYLGDPGFVKVPVAGLTSTAYADTIARRIQPGQVVPSRSIKPGNPKDHESNQTTHYSVIDRHGNAVAVTYTLNLNFGSNIVASGTGILMNNQMDDFSSKPGVPNAFGLVGGDANAIEAGKRPLSSMSPTMVMKDGKPWLVTGSPGGARIITTTLQAIVDTIDFGMNPAEAAASPRFHHQWLPDELRIEKGLSPDTVKLLTDQGYKVSVQPTMGRTQTIQWRDGKLYGYSDPRNPDGATMGY